MNTHNDKRISSKPNKNEFDSFFLAVADKLR